MRESWTVSGWPGLSRDWPAATPAASFGLTSHPRGWSWRGGQDCEIFLILNIIPDLLLLTISAKTLWQLLCSIKVGMSEMFI